MRRVAIILALAMLAGCAPDKPPQPVARNPFASPGRDLSADEVHVVRPVEKPQDVLPEVRQVVQLTIYRISLPQGAVSDNEEFWKHVNEQCLDVGPYDLLFKNGIRVGSAAAADWDYFKDILAKSPAKTQPITCTAARERTIEIEMKLNVESQTVFDFNRRNTLTGRNYDRSNNLLAISFQPAPRKPGYVRLAACPVIRAQRRKLVAVGGAEQLEIQEVHPEQYYDLGLAVDVPIDQFLIIAPSTEARWPASLGNALLVHGEEAERMEQLLVVVPTVYQEGGAAPGVAKAPTTQSANPRP